MEKYDILLPSKDESVCLDRSADDDNQSFYMYRAGFTKLGVRLPFSSFQMAVSQLHPNSWGFIRAFEIFCLAYNLLCTVRTFLHFLSVGTTTNRFEREVGRHGWTTFSSRRHIGVFTACKDAIKGFKDDFVHILVPARFPTVFLNDDGAPPLSSVLG